MGFLIIDKPAGMTSFDVIRQLRNITGIRKMGHAGTLDPMATGVLVIAVDKATKQLAGLIVKDKEYVAEILFGAVSDTYDREGRMELGMRNEELGMRNQELTEERIKIALKDFIGEIEQKPPVYSALKVKGKRACDIVRRGGKVELKARKVLVYGIEVLGFEWKKELGIRNEELEIRNQGLRIENQEEPMDITDHALRVTRYPLPILTLKIHCGSGFYVRSLAHDLGQKLGCGAVLWNLRRTRVGEFRIEEAVKLKELSLENWQKYVKEV